MTRRTGAAVSVAVLLVLAGCTVTKGDTAVTTPPPVPVTAGPDEIVWREHMAGGLVDPAQEAAEVADVVIYGDGRVFSIPTGEGSFSGAAEQYEVRQASPAALARFLTDADATGLLEDGSAYATMPMLDQGTTTVDARIGDEHRRVHVQGLDMAEFLDPRGLGFSDDQAQRRTELIELLDDAGQLGEDPQPYEPERVQAWTFGEMDDVEPSVDVLPWPGRPVAELGDGDGRGCTVLEGDEARAVYDAATSVREVAWSADDEVWEIVIAPLLPGQKGCRY